MEKIFANGNNEDKRDILIKINDVNIEFFFYDQYKRQNNYIQEMEEKYRNGECDKLEDEQKQIYGFYWINTYEWKHDKTNKLDREDNWHTHMKRKRWFTSNMEDYINNNL